MESRKESLIRALLRNPLTTDMLLATSQAFDRPYKDKGQLKRDLLFLYQDGYLNRQAIPSVGPGQKPYLYFLKRKAKLVVPEVEDIPSTDSTFRGLTEHPWHNLAVSEVLSHFERSAATSTGAVKLLAAQRAGRFIANLTSIPTGGSRESAKIIPDYTVVYRIDGKPNLFFIELQRKAPLINPINPDSISRSVKFKFQKYRQFQKEFQTHPTIIEWQKEFGYRFPGFRVIVVTTRTKANLAHLIEAARSIGSRSMFYFSTLDCVQNHNVFNDRTWTLPNGCVRGIED